MSAYINGISYYLPNKVLDNNELSILYPEWSVDKISQKTGIYTRHISEDNEFASDMALKAIEKLFEEYEIERNNVDYLLFCTQSPDYILPTTACILQDKAKISTNCGALDFNLGCSGYIYGLGLAKGLIESGQAKNVVLVTAETYTKYIHPSDKSNRTIFGDGATATFITSKPNEKFYIGRIRNFKYGTDGKGFDKLIVKNSGVYHKCKASLDVYDDEGNFFSNDDYLYMNGKEIFNFTAFSIPPLIKAILNLNNLSIDDISMFIFHQANAYMMDFVRKRCNIPENKFFVSINDVGNTVSSTIPIALRRYIDDTKLIKGQNILLSGFGVGLSMGAVVVETDSTI